MSYDCIKHSYYPGIYVERPKRFSASLSEDECRFLVKYRIEKVVSTYMGLPVTPDQCSDIAHASYEVLQSCLRDGLLPPSVSNCIAVGVSAHGQSSTHGNYPEDKISWPKPTANDPCAVDVGIPKWLEEWLEGGEI